MIKVDSPHFYNHNYLHSAYLPNTPQHSTKGYPLNKSIYLKHQTKHLPSIQLTLSNRNPTRINYFYPKLAFLKQSFLSQICSNSAQLHQRSCCPLPNLQVKMLTFLVSNSRLYAISGYNNNSQPKPTSIALIIIKPTAHGWQSSFWHLISLLFFLILLKSYWTCVQQFFTSINRTMKHTSIQNIITSDPTHLEQLQIRRLFQRHQYPGFELQDLKARTQLMKKQSYVSFVGLLQEWNKNVENPAKEMKQCDYRKNEFIFSWLKWVAVQNAKYIDSSLLQLQNWYNNSRIKQPTVAMRKENVTKSYAEEWEIRNSYKSNLPLEIDNYKRRALFQLKNMANSLNVQTQKNERVVDPLDCKMLEYAKVNKKQNCLIRQVREEQEMDDYLTTFRKSKVKFYKTLTKDYYKREFSRDKLEVATKAKERMSKTLQLKDYRIKTSTQGFRQFPRVDIPMLNQTEVSPFFQASNFDLQKSDFNEATFNTTLSELKPNITANIDGLGLLVNPFEIKIKKKKRS